MCYNGKNKKERQYSAISIIQTGQDISRQIISTFIKNINPDATVNGIDVNEWVECREENKFTFKTDISMKKP